MFASQKKLIMSMVLYEIPVFETHVKNVCQPTQFYYFNGLIG